MSPPNSAATCSIMMICCCTGAKLPRYPALPRRCGLISTTSWLTSISGFGGRFTRLVLFQPDEIVVDLPDEIDKDRLFDVTVAADHRLVGEDDPKRIVGIVFRAGPRRQ